MTAHKERQRVGLAEPEQVVYDYLNLLLKEVDKQQPEVSPVVEIKPYVALPIEEALPEVDLTLPEWAEEPFQSLIFRVQGVAMAVPLLLLDGILKWEEDAVPMPWQPEWHMGVLPYRDRQMVVVDTVQLLMPDKAVEDEAARGRGSHILVIGDGRWGLACDSLTKPVVLRQDEVKWSGQNPDRAWAAGTIIDKLCLLLDLSAVEDMISNENALDRHE